MTELTETLKLAAVALGLVVSIFNWVVAEQEVTETQGQITTIVNHYYEQGCKP